MYPFTVDALPTEIFSIKTLSPTIKGKLVEVLYPTDNVTVTFFVNVSNVILLIPTPLELFIGMIFGGIL